MQRVASTIGDDELAIMKKPRGTEWPRLRCKRCTRLQRKDAYAPQRGSRLVRIQHCRVIGNAAYSETFLNETQQALCIVQHRTVAEGRAYSPRWFPVDQRHAVTAHVTSGQMGQDCGVRQAEVALTCAKIAEAADTQMDVGQLGDPCHLRKKRREA